MKRCFAKQDWYLASILWQVQVPIISKAYPDSAFEHAMNAMTTTGA